MSANHDKFLFRCTPNWLEINNIKARHYTSSKPAEIARTLQMDEDLLKDRTDSFVERLFGSKFLLHCTEVRVTFHCDRYFLFRRTKPGVTILDVTCNVTQKNVKKTSVYSCFEKGWLTYEENLNATRSKVIMGNGGFTVA